VVQAIHDKHTVGIRFLDISSRKREQVKQLIEDIREMREQGLGNRDLVPGPCFTTPPPVPPREPSVASPCGGRACGRSSP
jgi:hypothetical protein